MAFLRVLRLICRWDWAASPLVVDVTGDLTAADARDVLTHFKAVRGGSAAPDTSISGPPMYIVSSLVSRCAADVWGSLLGRLSAGVSTAAKC